tara:strand:- start:105 stop:401 length:297 start_codon:yes stop_codon:yes gene_type:complete
MPYDKNNYVRTKKQREQIAKGHAEWKKELKTGKRKGSGNPDVDKKIIKISTCYDKARERGLSNKAAGDFCGVGTGIKPKAMANTEKAMKALKEPKIRR